MVTKRITITLKLFMLFFLILNCSIKELYALDIQSIDEKNLDQFINKSNNDSYKVFYFFTSWCSECRRSFRILLESQESLNKIGVRIYYISLDYEEKFLKKYLVRFNHIDGKVYFMRNAQQEIPLFFERNDIQFDQSVPFIVIFDENNKLTASGGYEITKVIDSLKAGLS